MTRIALVTIWSGPLPRYLPLFLGTAACNPDVRFVFVADSPALPHLPSNVDWVERSFSELMGDMGTHLGMDLPVVSAYKMCDFKPTFGRSLPDIVGDVDFWGHIDCDMVVGDLRGAISEDVLAEHDIVSLRGRQFVHGPLTLYRNTDAVNDLFMRADEWRQTLSNPRCLAFTETAGWWAWRGEARPLDVPESFTDVVLRAVEAGEIRWYDIERIKESRPYRGMRLQWACRGGRATLTDEEGKALAYYHFVSAKSDPAFRMPNWPLDAFPAAFDITNKGARTSREPALPLDATWAFDRAVHRVRHLAGRVARRLFPAEA